MNKVLTKLGLGAALAATALTTAMPANAQRYGYRHYGRGGDEAGAALLGGIVGLGVGAAIASSNRDRYYDRGYYDRGYYNRGYNGYYNGGYYDRGYADSYYRPHCWTEGRWDPYYGGRVPVRVCR